jgi:hypothetical protein
MTEGLILILGAAIVAGAAIAMLCDGLVSRGGPEPEIPNASGVYVILNRETMRSYIGKSSNLAQRCKAHRSALNCGSHINDELRKEWRVYGEACFTIAVFALVPEDSVSALEESLLEESWGECFNVARRGGGVARRGPETVPVSFRFPRWVARRIRSEAATRGMSISAYVLEAFKPGLSDVEDEESCA